MKLKYGILMVTVIALSVILFIPVSADDAAFSESPIPGIDFELYVGEDRPVKILALNDINL
ncbi:MAG: hypothetical protein IJB24_02825, partial [Clostridia bacterium]|nr:hypothetical protein [Clostridia bacterium]